MTGLFVTGTDTGVGKTVVAAAICAALRARGRSVSAWKPVVTGMDETADPGWPPDRQLLGAAAGTSPDAVTPLTFGPAVSPHLAAEMAGMSIEPAWLVASARAAGERAEVLVTEGVGGLLVPLTLGFSLRDLARELALPVVVVARPGLGTINHTLLTVEAARAVGLTVAGLVMTPWPGKPSGMERSNRETVARLAGADVAVLPRMVRGDPALLAEAGAGLPLDAWLGA